MFRTIKDFTQCWKSESESTLKVFKALTDKSLNTKVYNEGRTLGYIAKHLIISLCEGDMCNKLNIKVSMSLKEIESLKTVKELCAAYYKLSKEILTQTAKLKDEVLLDKINIYGEKWTKGFTLFTLINHQTHHRGQMTVLMRQAGLKVPGVCGPSKEEWAAYGMPSQE
jgi:uncharacterized damage-inducible protein DinB